MNYEINIGRCNQQLPKEFVNLAILSGVAFLFALCFSFIDSLSLILGAVYSIAIINLLEYYQ